MNFTKVVKGKNKTAGPQAIRYNPSEDKTMKFKGGEKQNNTDKICKKRYQMIAVTNLNATGAVANARILQSATGNSMTLMVGTSDFSNSFSKILFATGAVFLSVLTFLTF